MNKGEFYKSNIIIQQEAFDNEKKLEGKKLVDFFKKALSEKNKTRTIKIGNQNIELQNRDGINIHIAIRELQSSKKYTTTSIDLTSIMGNKDIIEIKFYDAIFNKKNTNTIDIINDSNIGGVNLSTGDQILPEIKKYANNDNKDEGILHDGVIAINKIFEKIFISKENLNQTKASSLPEQFKKYISGILQN